MYVPSERRFACNDSRLLIALISAKAKSQANTEGIEYGCEYTMYWIQMVNVFHCKYILLYQSDDKVKILKIFYELYERA